MNKILTIGLVVLVSVFLGGMISGSRAYAFAGEGFNGPSITADVEFPPVSIAYDSTLEGANSYAMNSGEANGPSITADIESPPVSIAYDSTLSNCPAYAMNELREEAFSGPVISSESSGAVWGTEDVGTLVAMLCR